MRDEIEDILGPGAVQNITGLAQGAYQPDRVVAAPPGRQRAARVAESGSLGGGGRRPSVVMPYETMRRSFDAGAPKSPDPQEAWRRLTSQCHEEHGAAVRDPDALADPAGKILAEGGFIWIALQGMSREPLGCVALYKQIGDAQGTDGDQGTVSWELGELSVLPDSRRQGIGQQLVDMLLRQYQEAAGEGDALRLQVPAAFEASKPFFLKMGFQEASAAEGGECTMVYSGRHAPRAADEGTA
mmetsp:Transcript_82919/g.162578  ORF Transcript_82919/g.162578 Transcript_82919/m.162578 type:complete len:242 (+) Transcript_82919:63-788(+)